VAAARHDDVALHADPALVELSQGKWEGLTHDDVRERYRDELAAWRKDPVRHHAPGGESLAGAADRASAAIARILDALPHRHSPPPESVAARGPAEPVLGYDRRPAGAEGQPPEWSIVVAHDGILRLLLMDLLGLPLEHYWSFPFGLCCVTVVELRAGTVRMRAHNLAEHLGRLPDETSDSAIPEAGRTT
jgi:probable phosphoglycerate mutase